MCDSFSFNFKIFAKILFSKFSNLYIIIFLNFILFVIYLYYLYLDYIYMKAIQKEKWKFLSVYILNNKKKIII